MYTLNKNAFGLVDTNQIQQFVRFWEHYYRDNVNLPKSKTRINYLDELNLESELSEQNIIRLLRWKDQRMLTHPKIGDDSAQKPNPRVQRVLEKLEEINKFRAGLRSAKNFEDTTNKIFPNGFIWQLFLFHIARPGQWPIADKNVFLAYEKLFKKMKPDNIKSFQQSYSKEFQVLAKKFRNYIKVDDTNIRALVNSNKRLDNAFFAFGQFLNKYG